MAVARRLSLGDRRPRSGDDPGSILIITLVLTVVLASVVMAITTYAATGLRSSRVTDGRLERLAAAEAGVWWGAEQLVGGADCGDLGEGTNPEGLRVNGEIVAVACTFVDPMYRLVGSVLIGASVTSVEATVQVVPGTGSYQVLDLRVRG